MTKQSTNTPPHLPLLNEMGYSLITTAIVITTIGLIVTALSSMYFIYERKKSVMETQEVMTKAREGLERFIAIKGHLPCPAPINAAQDSTYYNAEPVSGAACRTQTFSGITTPDGIATVQGHNDPTKNVHIGALPTRTLGLPDNAAFDAYGKRIVYAVTAIYTDPAPAFSDFNKANGQIELSLNQDLDGDGTEDSALNVAGTAIYTIISPGQDNRGAYSIDGSLIEPCDTSGFASENCDFSDAIFNISMNRNYGTGEDSYTDSFFYRASFDLYEWEISYGACVCYDSATNTYKTRQVTVNCVDSQGTSVSDSMCKTLKPSATPVDCSADPDVADCYGWYPTTSTSSTTGACSSSCGGTQTTTTTTTTTWYCKQNANSSLDTPNGRIDCLREGDIENDPNPSTQTSSTSSSCGGSCSSSSGGNDSGGGHYYDSDGDGITDTYASGAGFGSAVPGVSTDYNHYTGNAEDSGGGSSSSSRVLCTHYYRRKRLPFDLYWADIEYTMTNIHPLIVRGYHVWAIPLVRYLRNNEGGWLDKFMWFLTKHRAQELAYQMGIRPKPDHTGRIIRWLLEPPCYVIGLLFDPEDYKSLYHRSELRRLEREFRSKKAALA